MQPVLHHRFPQSLRDQPVDDRLLGLLRVEPVELARVDEDEPGLGLGGSMVGPAGVAGGGGREYPDDLLPVLRGELEVALVVGRDRHDRTGPVFHQDVVGDPDRNRVAARRIDGKRSGEHPGLFPLPHLAGDQVLGRRPHLT